MAEERHGSQKERIDALESEARSMREKERAAATAKREVESIAESLRERLKLVEERAQRDAVMRNSEHSFCVLSLIHI